MYVQPLSIVILCCVQVSMSSNVLRGFNGDLCDPHTVTSDHYPSLLMRLSVQKTSPLKLKAIYRLSNMAAQIAACRSLGATSMTWYAQPDCEFSCPDRTSAKQICRYVIKKFQCPGDAISLLECLTSERSWEYASNTPGFAYQGIDLKCIECGDQVVVCGKKQ